MLMGTPAYMSPEQCRGGSKAVDGRSDVYSLGCIFYEVLCGQPPFVRDGAGELIVAHVAEPPDDPRKLVPELPAEIAGLVLRMLGKNVQDRPSDMGVVSAEIAGCVAGLGISRPLGGIHPITAVEVPQIPGGVGPLATPTPGIAARSPVPSRRALSPRLPRGAAPAQQPADAAGGAGRGGGRSHSDHARRRQRPAGDDASRRSCRAVRRRAGRSPSRWRLAGRWRSSS